jgi:hypothetical protein
VGGRRARPRPTRWSLPALLTLGCPLLLVGALTVRADEAGDDAASDRIAPVVGVPATGEGLVESLSVDTSRGDVPARPEKGGDWIVAPIPISQPSLGSGLGLVVGTVRPLRPSDAKSPPSMFGVGGFKTDNGSWGAGVATRMYLAEDRYRVTAGFGLMDLQYDFYGIGSGAGDRGRHVPLSQEGHAFALGCLRRVSSSFFVGARYLRLDMEIGLDLSGVLDPGEWEFPDIRVSTRAAGLGAQAQRDTRDSAFYPRRGSLFSVTADFFDEALGGDHDVQAYALAFNQYRSLGKRGVLAWRAYGRSAQGERIPFYLLSRFGGSDLRGYGTGRYQDDAMAAVQVEYRLELPKRFGLAFFAGAGGVGPEVTDIDDLLPSAGVGLRYRATKKSHVNLRVDYAVGEHGGTFHVAVGEAF